jgi:hypothetical protein
VLNFSSKNDGFHRFECWLDRKSLQRGVLVKSKTLAARLVGFGKAGLRQVPSAAQALCGKAGLRHMPGFGKAFFGK